MTFFHVMLPGLYLVVHFYNHLHVSAGGAITRAQKLLITLDDGRRATKIYKSNSDNTVAHQEIKIPLLSIGISSQLVSSVAPRELVFASCLFSILSSLCKQQPVRS